MAEEEKGRVVLPLEDYQRLVQPRARAPSPPPPQKAFVTGTDIRGSAEPTHVALFIEFDVSVLAGGWTTCALLPGSVSVLRSAVTRQHADSADAEEGDRAGRGDSGRGDAAEGAFDAHVCVAEGAHSLIVRGAGSYRVSLECHAPYASERGTHVHLEGLPLSNRNHLEFVVRSSGKETQVTVEPSIGSAVESDESAGTVTVVCSFPPSRALDVQWTQVQSGGEEAAEGVDGEEEETLLSAEQLSMHTIGEKLLSSGVVFRISMIRGMKSVFLIEMERRCRVLHVGGDGVKRWEVVAVEDAGGVGVDEGAEGAEGAEEGGRGDRQLLRIVMTRCVETHVDLTVLTEIDLESTSCEASIPVFACRDVQRESGFVAVEARTSVEIMADVESGATRVDVDELPGVLKEKATTVILHAFKFLMPRYAIHLDVRRHDDVAVLIAIINSAHLTTTIAKEGTALHRLLLSIKNTHKQYLRISLPENEHRQIWSTLVEGKPVKPASDGGGDLMVPLEKESQKRRNVRPFVVEIVYTTRHTAPGERQPISAIDIEFPTFDVPVRQMFSSIYVPTGLSFSVVASDLDRVSRFSQNPPVRTIVFPDEESTICGRGQERTIGAAPVTIGADFGVLPVQVDPLHRGTHVQFERLLVRGERLAISMRFRAYHTCAVL